MSERGRRRWSPPGVGNTAYANNGKNQVTAVNGAGVAYDGRQNITGVPGLGSYGYNGANELTSATVNGTTTGLSYDPAGRLYQSGPTRFLYDGVQAIGEYDTAGNLQKRYVPGLGLDEVVTAYEGAGYDRRWLLADERGSVISITDGAAGALATNSYDEYGVPGAGASGRFQYTGQMWLPQAQLYHYRARAYAPQLGRFMQTDPIGYAAGANVYAYVGADPMNWADPFGLKQEPPPTDLGEIVVTAPRPSCGAGLVEVGRARDGTRICESLDRVNPRPGAGGGSGSGGGGADRTERERFCAAYSAVSAAAQAFKAAHDTARTGASAAAGRQIDLRALDLNLKLLEWGNETTRVWGEIRAGRSWRFAVAGAVARMSVDALATRTGVAAGAAVGIETGPGAIVLAGVGGFALPVLLDASGVREAVGDLAAGVAVGLTPEDCNG